MVTPATTSLKSMFAPCGPGLSELMHSFPAGAVPMVPKNGRIGTSTLPILLFGMSSVATLRFLSRCQMNRPVGRRRRHHRGLVLGRKQPETGNRGAPAPVAIEIDAVDMDLQRVARLGTLDVERAGLRIDLGQVELRARPSCRMTENTSLEASRVLGDHGVAGLDARGRRMGVAVGEINLVARIVLHFGRQRPAGRAKARRSTTATRPALRRNTSVS